MQTPLRLSATRIAAARREIAPALRDTPCWSNGGLSRALGCELVVKDETRGSLGCFKGRGADLFVAQWRGSGPLVCASAGNFGLALADAGHRRGVAVVVFVATTASPFKVARIRERGAEVIEHGIDFDAAKAAARAHGGMWVEDGAEVAISEGAGTVAAELDAGLDAIVVPVGNGALIAGIGTWLRAHHPQTQVIGVCAAGAPVMRTCWQHGLAAAPANARADTIADGIAVRVPVAEAVADLAHVIDDLVTVEDAELLAAMRSLHALTGIAAEPSAVAGLAAIAADRDRFAGRRVATILTGNNLTRDQHTRWLG
ncbi:MAG: pyridoxal-phosphate dependent enzyme [Kofleriaceae bacterium]